MPDDNSTGASFGVFPQMKPTRSFQDPEASKDMPVQLVRGAVKTGLGMVPDIAQTALDIAGNDTKLPLTSDWWEQKLPLKATSPEGRFASAIGEYSPFNPLMEAVPKAIGKGASIAGQGLSEAMMGQGPDWLKAMVPQPLGINAPYRRQAGEQASHYIASSPQTKLSEALGNLNVEGKGRLITTQSDRTKVGGGNIGGASFPAISQVDPEYSGKVWGVMDEGTASRLLNLNDENAIYTTMLGSADQHKSNPVVFDQLKREFLKNLKAGKMSPELEDKFNKNLQLFLGPDANIKDPQIWKLIDTFEKRGLVADLMMGKSPFEPKKGGISMGGEKSGKGVIFKPSDILRAESEPNLLHPEHGGEIPTYAIGPRMFRLSGDTSYRPDLHPGFPTLLHGEDLNQNFVPVETEIALPNWHKRFKELVEAQNKINEAEGKKIRTAPAGYYDLALGIKGEGLPSQDITEKYLTWLQRHGKKKGGSVHMSDNLDTQWAETAFAGGGKVGLAEDAVSLIKGIMEGLGTKEVSKAEAEANKAKFLEPSKEKNVMYHGTFSDFNQFKPSQRGAIFVSPKTDFVNHYIGMYKSDEANKPHIMPVHVNVQNPFDYENPLHLSNLYDEYAQVKGKPLPEKTKQQISEGHWYELENPEVMNLIKSLGHDSMYLTEHNDQNELVKNLGVFDPTQIKSAIGNQGTYDVTNPDITKKRGGPVHMAGGGEFGAIKSMLAEAPELAHTIRGLFTKEAPDLNDLIEKIKTSDRQPVIPMPNRWFTNPEENPQVQPLVEKVLNANNMKREDFHSGAFIDPKTGLILDNQIHKDVGVAIDPLTNRPIMTTGGVTGMESLPKGQGSFTNSNLLKQGKYKPVGGDSILNDLGFIATVDKAGMGHAYGLGTDYASPVLLNNLGTGSNPTLRPRSVGDVFGIGDVVGQMQINRNGPVHDVYEKLLVAPKGSDVQGVKLSKKKGGKVTKHIIDGHEVHVHERML